MMRDGPDQQAETEGRMRQELLRSGRGLYLVMTEPRLPHVELASAACERGVPIMQLREKHMEDDRLVALAREIAAVARAARTLFVVNDRPDIAAACRADGVHLGKGDVSYEEARTLLGPDAVIGLSTRTPEESQAALAAGADYIGVGPVFPTPTKPDAEEPIGLDGLRDVTRRVRGLPVVAIGGVDSDNVAEILAAGARYAAVVSAICYAHDPLAAMDEFLLAVERPGRPDARGGRP